MLAMTKYFGLVNWEPFCFQTNLISQTTITNFFPKGTPDECLQDCQVTKLSIYTLASNVKFKNGM